MSSRHRRSGRLAVVLSALIVATLAPNLPPVAAAEETGPTTPVKLPVQPGTDNTLDLVRRQTPADIDITEPGGGAMPDPGTKRVTPPRDVAPATKTDVAALRAEFSSITANPDGTYTATISGDRQNYRDESGDWQPIDTTLVVDATDGFTLRSKANDRIVRIDEQPIDGVVATIEIDDYLVRLISPIAKAGTLDRAGNEVDFATDAGDGLIVGPTPEGLEFSFRLRAPTSPRALEVTLDTGGLVAQPDKDGRSVLLADAKGRILASVTAPITYDAAGIIADEGLTTVELHPFATAPTGVDQGATATPTPHHRFLTTERGWVEAEDLVPGEHVPSVTGGSGVVWSLDWTGGLQTMYDLTVASIHTYAVGTGGWVVHNCGGNSLASTNPQHLYEILETTATGQTKTHKFGVSGGPVSKSGASYRATRQVNDFNRSAASGLTYSARITATAQSRRDVLDLEWSAVYGTIENLGYRPAKNFRP